MGLEMTSTLAPKPDVCIGSLVPGSFPHPHSTQPLQGLCPQPFQGSFSLGTSFLGLWKCPKEYYRTLSLSKLS